MFPGGKTSASVMYCTGLDTYRAIPASSTPPHFAFDILDVLDYRHETRSSKISQLICVRKPLPSFKRREFYLQNERVGVISVLRLQENCDISQKPLSKLCRVSLFSGLMSKWTSSFSHSRPSDLSEPWAQAASARARHLNICHRCGSGIGSAAVYVLHSSVLSRSLYSDHLLHIIP